MFIYSTVTFSVDPKIEATFKIWKIKLVKGSDLYQQKELVSDSYRNMNQTLGYCRLFSNSSLSFSLSVSHIHTHRNTHHKPHPHVTLEHTLYSRNPPSFILS